MKTKQLLISLLINASDDRLADLCSMTPCTSFNCHDCPFRNEQQRDAAVLELSKELDNE